MKATLAARDWMCQWPRFGQLLAPAASRQWGHLWAVGPWAGVRSAPTGKGVHVSEGGAVGRPSSALRRVLVPLALAQFICSFAGSNMNVMINDISEDLDTTVQGVQIAITIFLLVMAALMIPGGKLTDRYGRKRLLHRSAWSVYGVGALLSAVSPGLGVLILGNSIFEGVGTALLIPPVYILTTLLFTEVTSRARAFGAISAMGGIGAAAGPLIGGLITSAISWRAAFVFQALVIAVIVLLSRRIKDPLPPDPDTPLRHRRGGPVGRRPGPGRHGHPGRRQQPLADARPDRRRRPRPGLVLPLGARQGARRRGAAAVDGAVPQPHLQPRPRHAEHPVAAAHGDVVRRLGLPAGRARLRRDPDRRDLHRRHGRACCCRRSPPSASRSGARSAPSSWPASSSRIAGIGVLLALVSGSPSVWAFAPGLLLIGLGIGAMLTPSVNVVQSSFPEELQGEISGLSRSVSNLGSSLGTAIAGTILVAGITSTPGRAYGLATGRPWPRSASSGWWPRPCFPPTSRQRSHRQRRRRRPDTRDSPGP